MTRLSVNLNKIALVRNSRTIGIPSIIDAAKVCIDSGAYGITVHPRPDERHIRYSDVYQLKPVVKDVEFNIEGNPFQGRYMELMPEIRPAQATLVPDSCGQVTSDHGWQLNEENCNRLLPVIEELKSLGIRTSIFVDPVIKIVETAKKIGADRIELYTEPFASAFTSGENIESVTAAYTAAALRADQIGLGVNAGHDLNLDNLGYFCDNVSPVAEVSIGHALVSDAIFMGLSEAVQRYCKILKSRK